MCKKEVKILFIFISKFNNYMFYNTKITRYLSRDNFNSFDFE